MYVKFKLWKGGSKKEYKETYNTNVNKKANLARLISHKSKTHYYRQVGILILISPGGYNSSICVSCIKQILTKLKGKMDKLYS